MQEKYTGKVFKKSKVSKKKQSISWTKGTSQMSRHTGI